MPMPAVDRVFFAGLVVKTGLAGAKLMIGYLSGSQALLADGAHSLSDTVTNSGAWLSHRWAQAPPDDDHHYGHGNIESVAALLIGLLLSGGGIGIVAAAALRDTHARPDLLGMGAILMSVVSIAANLWLSYITRRMAHDLNSPTLTALDRDHRSDALSSLLVITGVAGSMLGMPWIERLFAGGIGVLVTGLGLRSAREGLDVLMDRVADPALRENLLQATSDVAGVCAVQALRLHPVGSQMRVDLEISVLPDLTVREGHVIAHRVAKRLTDQNRMVSEVHVHVNPHEGPEPSA